MSSAPRGPTKDKTLHVYNRSAHGKRIFTKKRDYYYFMELFQRKAIRYKVTIYQYCLMPTHYHFMVKSHTEKGLPNLMRDIQSKFSKRYNKHYKTHGPNWDGRYKSKEVNSNLYHYNLWRYVDNNPVKSGLVKKAKHWEYSSLGQAYLQEKKRKKGQFKKGQFNKGQFNKGAPEGQPDIEDSNTIIIPCKEELFIGDLLKEDLRFHQLHKKLTKMIKEHEKQETPKEASKETEQQAKPEQEPRPPD